MTEQTYKYNVIFHEDLDGNSEPYEYIMKLAEKSLKSKDARIKYNKIVEYMRILKSCGCQVGEPYTKHIEGELYELRPIRDRFFFIYEEKDCYVILHHFMKTTQKTPRREIETALKIIKERKTRNENL